MERWRVIGKRNSRNVRGVGYYCSRPLLRQGDVNRLRFTLHPPLSTLHRLSDSHAIIQVHVLDRPQQGCAFGHRLLERLAAGDQAHAAGALVDDGRAHSLRQVVLAEAPPELIRPMRPM